MTREEFQNTKFFCGMEIIFDDYILKVYGVDFHRQRIAVKDNVGFAWLHRVGCELIKSKKKSNG